MRVLALDANVAEHEKEEQLEDVEGQKNEEEVEGVLAHTSSYEIFHAHLVQEFDHKVEQC